MAIVKVKRFLNGKLFNLTDPNDLSNISDVNFEEKLENWEKLFISVFV